MATTLSLDTPATRQLHRAVEANNPARIAAALADGAWPNLLIGEGLSSEVLLARAVSRGKQDAVQALLSGGADPGWMGPEGENVSAFCALARLGNVVHVKEWLSRFPYLRDPSVLRQAMGSLDARQGGVFDVLIAVARKLPRASWQEERGLLADCIERMAGAGWVSRMNALAGLDDGLRGHPALTRGLIRAVAKNAVDCAKWLLEQGADPFLASSPSNDFTGDRSAHEEAIRSNRVEMLALWPYAFQQDKWLQDCCIAIEKQSRSVFDHLWREGSLPEKTKRELLLCVKVDVRHRVDIRSLTRRCLSVSPIEAVCWGQASAQIPSWVRRILSLGLATPEQMGQALHALFARSVLHRRPTRHEVSAAMVLYKAGADLSQKTPEGQTVQEAASRRVAWGELTSAIQAAEIDLRLPDAPRHSRPRF